MHLASFPPQVPEKHTGLGAPDSQGQAEQRGLGGALPATWADLTRVPVLFKLMRPKSHHGNKPLGIYKFLDRINCNGKTHPKYVGSTIPCAGVIDRIKGENELGTSVHCSLLPDCDTRQPAASRSCCRAFPSTWSVIPD